MPIAIRLATPADADTIAAFNAAMALETEHKRLQPERVAAGTRRLIADPALGFYLVAEDAGAVLGSLMITTEWSDWRNAQFWWLQSVYVRPEARRHGVFRLLYAHLQSMIAADPGICGLRLYVEKDNAVAQATYRALGMLQTDYLVDEALRPGERYFDAP